MKIFKYNKEFLKYTYLKKQLKLSIVSKLLYKSKVLDGQTKVLTAHAFRNGQVTHFS